LNVTGLLLPEWVKSKNKAIVDLQSICKKIEHLPHVLNWMKDLQDLQMDNNIEDI